jgi:hypothetical protein
LGVSKSGKVRFPAALADVAIRNAGPGKKAIKLADGGGMFLLVDPTGGRLWRLKYRIDRREKLLAIGFFPEIGLPASASAESRTFRGRSKCWSRTN